jgi:hypothetical protein
MHRATLRCRLAPWLTIVILGAVLAPALARAQSCFSSQDCLPPPGCADSGTNTIAYPPTAYQIRNVTFLSPTHCDPPPPPGGSIDSFFDIFVELQISNNNGASWSPANGTAHCHQRDTTEPNGTIDTEMLSMNLTGGSLPGSVALQESPSMTSAGQTTVQPVSGGFQINSFFDVFTELSLDGGQSWNPGDNSEHETITTPNPTAAFHATWGALKVLYR